VSARKVQGWGVREIGVASSRFGQSSKSLSESDNNRHEAEVKETSSFVGEAANYFASVACHYLWGEGADIPEWLKSPKW